MWSESGQEWIKIPTEVTEIDWKGIRIFIYPVD